MTVATASLGPARPRPRRARLPAASETRNVGLCTSVRVDLDRIDIERPRRRPAPTQNSHHRARRLYQPETRSIAASYHAATFRRATSRLSPACSTSGSSDSPTVKPAARHTRAASRTSRARERPVARVRRHVADLRRLVQDDVEQRLREGLAGDVRRVLDPPGHVAVEAGEQRVVHDAEIDPPVGQQAHQPEAEEPAARTPTLCATSSISPEHSVLTRK